MLIAAFLSLSRETPHASQWNRLSPSVSVALITPQLEQSFEDLVLASELESWCKKSCRWQLIRKCKRASSSFAFSRFADPLRLRASFQTFEEAVECPLEIDERVLADVRRNLV
jgi:hypothetical protein